MSRKKPTTEYRWEAFDPDTGRVVKRGPIREDLAKTTKYMDEIIDDIVDGRLANIPYWQGLRFRIVTRTITPWVNADNNTYEPIKRTVAKV